MAKNNRRKRTENFLQARIKQFELASKISRNGGREYTKPGSENSRKG